MAVSQALSEEEFHRMQAQLLELRTQNYQLSDDLRKNSAELNAVRQKNASLEKDYSKAQKALNKSRKAQEVDALLSENEMLQVKLHSQEEDFRLQNKTLMSELSKLCTQIEQLEQENQELKGGGASALATPPNSASSPVDEEMLRLQAENATLQKKMRALQDLYDKEVQKPLVSQSSQSVTTETDGANGVSDVTERREEPAGGGASKDQEETELQQKLQQIHGVSEKTALGWSELETSLNTEREEKRLLREQIHHLEASKQSEITRLQEEISKLSEKLKKKQESFQRLQTEKEVLYNDSRTKIEEMNQRKEEEVKALNTRIQKLQSDVTAANQTAAELREQLQSKEKEHEVAVNALKDQVASQSAVSQEQVDNILQENDALRTNLAALEQIQTVKTQEMNLLRDQQEALTAERENLLAQRDDLESQLQESSFANRKLLEQLTEEGHEKDKLLRELDEAKKTAEKRKSMLDDMSMQLNQEKSVHKEALSDLRLQHEKEVLGVRARYEKELRGLHEDKNRSEEEIRQQLREEKARTRELGGFQVQVEELQAQLQSMEETRGCLEGRLQEAQNNIEKNSLQHQEELQRLQREHSLQLQDMLSEMQVLKQQLLEVDRQKDEHMDTIGKLRQEIKDTVDGQRILEKKGSAALKDLKRQLQLERKRGDKLQERLQDILTNSKTRTGLEDLVLSEINSPSRTQQTGDSSSVSSFSYRDMMKETQPANQSKSGGGSPQSQRPDLSEEEVGELFQRLAEVQQEKWMLEEKVKHLEVSCSSMAEDICRKSCIIQTYVMDSRRDVSGGVAGGAQGDRGGLSSVLRDLVKPGDENLREMNKKLQNMLEEQLTKNLHLHKDLEVLSQELVRLSKDTSPGGGAAGSG
ncbi:GRIP1-associated protein 1 isoform X2 [Mugil cephalus]|uniref:GRIP1-associated protein 1 isoform X2 n=1 Tax=Mugil cephalus TaxID=48193 RepID=UPI001FB81CFD|nr:GRIP1-associated protein 1 isoform X2 [Mugil cephalus]